MKRCIGCKQWKEESEFYKDKSRKDGLQTQCKECHKKYREENKEKIAEREKKYKGKNKEKYDEYKKKWKEKNPEYNKNNRIKINNEIYTLNTAPEEMKPLLKKAIHLRDVKNELKQNRNKILKIQENIG